VTRSDRADQIEISVIENSPAGEAIIQEIVTKFRDDNIEGLLANNQGAWDAFDTLKNQFISSFEMPVVVKSEQKKANGTPIFQLRIPVGLRPAYATTVHKVQGSTLRWVFYDQEDVDFNWTDARKTLNTEQKKRNNRKTRNSLHYVALTRAQETVMVFTKKVEPGPRPVDDRSLVNAWSDEKMGAPSVLAAPTITEALTRLADQRINISPDTSPTRGQLFRRDELDRAWAPLVGRLEASNFLEEVDGILDEMTTLENHPITSTEHLTLLEIAKRTYPRLELGEGAELLTPEDMLEAEVRRDLVNDSPAHRFPEPEERRNRVSLQAGEGLRRELESGSTSIRVLREAVRKDFDLYMPGGQAYFDLTRDVLNRINNVRGNSAELRQSLERLMGGNLSIAADGTPTNGRIVILNPSGDEESPLQVPTKTIPSALRRDVVGFVQGAAGEITQEERDDYTMVMLAVSTMLEFVAEREVKAGEDPWAGVENAPVIPGRGVYKTRPDGTTVIPQEDRTTVGEILEKHWGPASPLYRKLLAEGTGRTAEMLNPLTIAKEFRKEFDKAIDEFEAVLAPLGLQHLILRREGYFPHFIGNGVLTAAQEFAIKEELNELEKMKLVPGEFEEQWGLSVEELTADLEKAPEDRTKASRELVDAYTELLEQGLSMPKFNINWSRIEVIEAMHRGLMRTLINDALKKVSQGAEADLKLSPKLRRQLKFLGDQNRIIKGRAALYKEWTERQLPRTYRTWFERTSATGDRPGFMNPGDALAKYAQETYRATFNQVLINAGLLTADMDGRPHIVAVPRKNFEGRPSYDATSLLRMAENLARFLDFDLNKRGDIPEQVREMSDILLRRFPNDFEAVGTNHVFPSIDKFLVAKGDGRFGWGENERFALAKIVGERHHKNWPRWVPFRKDKDMMQDLMNVTQFMKFSTLSFSLFFANSALESFTASQGVPGFIKFIKAPKKSFQAWRDFREQLLANNLTGVEAEDLQNLIRAGYTFDISRDESHVNMGVPDRVIKYLENWKKNSKKPWQRAVAGPGAEVVKFQRGFTRWMFNDWFPVFKTMSAFRNLRTLREEKGAALDDNDYRVVAKSMNDGFGGQNWNQYWWATPRFMQYLNLAVFAPNWTLSAFNIAGGKSLMNKFGLAPAVLQDEKNFMLKTYWPAMTSLVILGWPNFLQMAIWAGSRLGDDPDEEDDVPFTWMNEPGKRLNVDITPIARKLWWYDGGPTGKRRLFTKWGKQVYEVYGIQNSWMADARDLKLTRTFVRKLSAPVRLAIEMATGEVAGVEDWDLPFKHDGLIGLISSDEDGFLGSRLFHIARSGLPFSVSALMKDVKKFPFALFSSVSSGVTSRTATKDLARVLKTYADSNAWAKVKKNPRAKENLAALGSHILRGVERNGYPVKNVIDNARRAVLSDLYAEALQALDENKVEKLNRLAQSILRVNGTLRGLIQSNTSRETRYGKKLDLTPEQAEILVNSFK